MAWSGKFYFSQPRSRLELEAVQAPCKRGQNTAWGGARSPPAPGQASAGPQNTDGHRCRWSSWQTGPGHWCPSHGVQTLTPRWILWTMIRILSGHKPGNTNCHSRTAGLQHTGRSLLEVGGSPVGMGTNLSLGSSFPLLQHKKRFLNPHF